MTQARKHQQSHSSATPNTITTADITRICHGLAMWPSHVMGWREYMPCQRWRRFLFFFPPHVDYSRRWLTRLYTRIIFIVVFNYSSGRAVTQHDNAMTECQWCEQYMPGKESTADVGGRVEGGPADVGVEWRLGGAMEHPSDTAGGGSGPACGRDSAVHQTVLKDAQEIFSYGFRVGHPRFFSVVPSPSSPESWAMPSPPPLTPLRGAGRPGVGCVPLRDA